MTKINRDYEFMETDGLGYWRKKKTDWQTIGEIAVIVAILVIAILLI